MSSWSSADTEGSWHSAQAMVPEDTGDMNGIAEVLLGELRLVRCGKWADLFRGTMVKDGSELTVHLS